MTLDEKKALLRAIYSEFGRSQNLDEVMQAIEEDPDALIAALLEAIKKDIPKVSSTLYSTVQKSEGKVVLERRERAAVEKEREKK